MRALRDMKDIVRRSNIHSVKRMEVEEIFR